MATVTATVKGQIVIPADIRRKLKIRRGTRFLVTEENGKIIIEPISEDPITAGRGLLRTRGQVSERLLEDRRAESSR